MNAVFVLIAFCVSSSLAFNYTDVKCYKYPEPKNGKLICQKDVTASTNCHVRCNDGFDVEYLQAETYRCTPEGVWKVVPNLMTMPWPNCIEYGPGMPMP